jgi:dienelactone hydrolase
MTPKRGGFAPPSKLLRRKAALTLPHDRFNVRASDGVTLQGWHVHTLPGGDLREAAVIITHGAFRNKDLLAHVMLAARLADHFDVIAFDARGHGESGGTWTGDARVFGDLESVVDWVRDKGYAKIGVYGRSVGGWIAVQQQIIARCFDAVAMAGIPPGQFSEIPAVVGWIKLLRIPIIPLFVRLFTRTRFGSFGKAPARLIDIIGEVAPVPLLIAYNQFDWKIGVAGDETFAKAMMAAQRFSTILDYFRPMRYAFTAQQVYEAAREPKELLILPGAGHVYTLAGLHILFERLETWFKKHLLLTGDN